MSQIEIIRYPDVTQWEKLMQRAETTLSVEFVTKIKEIISQVERGGDSALKELTRQFDDALIDELRVSDLERKEAVQLVDPQVKDAILTAKRNIEKFHQMQYVSDIEVNIQEGVTCYQRMRPIRRIGLYIPSGSAPLFSTVLMLVIPAKIAGCKDIILCTPPNRMGEIDPTILYAASLCGVDRIFKVGGVQAIAAMAYGTETIPCVDKIFGPGNLYVTTAKQIVSMSKVAIDMPAGPSEVVVLADETANPAFVASDLLSQAEHGVDSQAILVTNSSLLLDQVDRELKRQLDQLPRKDIAAQALSNSKLILVNTMEEMISFSNQYAPEHLIICTQNEDNVGDQIESAGSVFLGNWSPESVGDYASGTNHTLPTHGWARSYSGVNLDSFMKKITFQKLTPKGLSNLGDVVITMASAEGLEAHANAVRVRLETLKN